MAQLDLAPILAAFAWRSVISTPPRFARDYSARATLAVFVERHRLRTADAERDQGVSRKPSLHLIRESRIASSPWAVSRTGFASGTAGSLNVAVASAGWRSLEARAIVRGASSNAISAVCALSDLIIPTPYCGWRTFLPIWSVSMFRLLSNSARRHRKRNRRRCSAVTTLAFGARQTHVSRSTHDRCFIPRAKHQLD